MANKLAREGIEASLSAENKGEESPPEYMIIDVLPQPLDSEGSNETDEDILRQHQSQNKLRGDL